MNWGYKIMFVYLGFVAFMLTLVLFTYSVNVDLVAKDYYKQELAYEKEINKQRNFRALTHKPFISYDADNKILVLTMNNLTDKGVIWLFRPSDKGRDLKIPLQPDAQGRQYIPVTNLDKGLWRIKIDWQYSQKAYFMEEKLAILPQGKVKLQAQLLAEEEAAKKRNKIK
jgi:hypothetical protein